MLLMGLSCLSSFAADEPKVDPKVSQILTAVIRDVLFADVNKHAREFYGTEGDKTVILLDGTGNDRKPVKWPQGFKAEVEGFTFVFGRDEGVIRSEEHNRRLAIRLDRFSIGAAKGGQAEKHPAWDTSPISISIQNGGGTKNGAVIGGQTTWYSFALKDQKWVVQYKGFID